MHLPTCEAWGGELFSKLNSVASGGVGLTWSFTDVADVSRRQVILLAYKNFFGVIARRQPSENTEITAIFPTVKGDLYYDLQPADPCNKKLLNTFLYTTKNPFSVQRYN